MEAGSMRGEQRKSGSISTFFSVRGGQGSRFSV